MVGGVSVVVGVIVEVPADGARPRAVLIVALPAGLLQVETTQAHGLQHHGQHAARAAVITEAAHQEAQGLVRVL